MTPRDLGIMRTGLGADPVWFAAAIAVVRWLATRHKSFTSDDVWDVLDRLEGIPQTPNRTALGSVMDQCRDDQIIRGGGIVNSRRPERHGGYVKTWYSLIHGDPAELPAPLSPPPTPLQPPLFGEAL